MCLGVPMQVIETDGQVARCTGQGRRETVSLALTGPVAPGCHVLVYLGSAVQVLEADEAGRIEAALEAVSKAMAGDPFEHLLQDLIDREPELPAHLQASLTSTEETS